MRKNHYTLPVARSIAFNSDWKYIPYPEDTPQAFHKRQQERIRQQAALDRRVVEC